MSVPGVLVFVGIIAEFLPFHNLTFIIHENSPSVNKTMQKKACRQKGGNSLPAERIHMLMIAQ